MESQLNEALVWIVEMVKSLGYAGIFIMTFIESTFIPIPAEITMVPAGYLIQKGEMDFWTALACSIAGAIGGSLFNYWVGMKYGRRLFDGSYKLPFLKPKKLAKIEKFFAEHGTVSTFTGRLLPGVRHYISFPAGIARMKLGLFCFYTGLGGGLWMLVLIGVGYFIGENEALAKKYLLTIAWTVGFGTLAFLAVYFYRRRASLGYGPDAPKD